MPSPMVQAFARRKWRLFLAAAALAVPGPAGATIVVLDQFTAANNTALIGRAPSPNNLLGAVYAGNGNVLLTGGPSGSAPYEADIQNNMGRLGADAGVAVDLNYASAQLFQITITFNLSAATQDQTTLAQRGAGLGFFDSVLNAGGGGSHGFNDFTGLVVDRAGSVRLITDGANSGIFTTLAGFNANLNHTLTYAVDTAAGTISNIQLDGNALSLAVPANTFTVARTRHAGFYLSSGSASSTADFDNFSVLLVPETPPVIGILGLLAAVLLQRYWRQRTRQR